MLFDFLSGKIIHATNYDNFNKIMQDGFIYPNSELTNRNFNMIYNQMNRMNNWISVFDTQNITKKGDLPEPEIYSILSGIIKSSNAPLFLLEIDIQSLEFIPPAEAQILIEKQCPDIKYGGKLPIKEVFERVGYFISRVEGFIAQPIPIENIKNVWTCPNPLGGKIELYFSS